MTAPLTVAARNDRKRSRKREALVTKPMLTKSPETALNAAIGRVRSAIVWRSETLSRFQLSNYYLIATQKRREPKPECSAFTKKIENERRIRISGWNARLWL